MWISPTSLFCSVPGRMDFPSNVCVMLQARDKPIGRLGNYSQVLNKQLCSSCFDSIHEPASTSFSPCSGFQASRNKLKHMSLNEVSPWCSQTVMKSKLKNMPRKELTPQARCGSCVFFARGVVPPSNSLLQNQKHQVPSGWHKDLGRDKRWELLCLQGDDCDFQAHSAPERWKFLLCTEVMYSFENMAGGIFLPL